MDGEQREKAEKLARDILILSRNMLMVNLRFLDEALARFEYVRADGVALQTDGHYLRYDPFYVLQRYGRERTAYRAALRLSAYVRESGCGSCGVGSRL